MRRPPRPTAPGDGLGAAVPGAGGTVGQPWVFGGGTGAPAGQSRARSWLSTVGACGSVRAALVAVPARPVLGLRGSWWSGAAAVQPARPAAASGAPELDGARCIQAGHHCRAVPKPQPCPVAFLQPVFNRLSWVFLVLFLITAIILSLVPISPPSPLPVAPRYHDALDPLCPSTSSQTPLAFRWLQRYFGSLAACPARFKFKASHIRMRGPDTRSLPKRSHGQGLAEEPPWLRSGWGLRGLHPFPAGLCAG